MVKGPACPSGGVEAWSLANMTFDTAPVSAGRVVFATIRTRDVNAQPPRYDRVPPGPVQNRPFFLPTKGRGWSRGRASRAVRAGGDSSRSLRRAIGRGLPL